MKPLFYLYAFWMMIALALIVILTTRAAHAQSQYYDDGNGYVTRYGQNYSDVESIPMHQGAPAVGISPSISPNVGETYQAHPSWIRP